MRGLDPVDHGLVAAETHHGFDHQPEHLHVDVQLVDFGEVGQADLSEGLPVRLQLGLQAFFLLLAHVVQPSLKLELPHCDLQPLPRLVDELSSWAGVFLLLLPLGVVVIVMLFPLFVELGVEEVDGPK